MIEPLSWLTVIGLILITTIKMMDWWTKKNDVAQKAKDDLKKQIDDAVASGDVSRLNDIINRLRR